MHGMKNNKVTEVISFRRKMWLKKYINFITLKKSGQIDFRKTYRRLNNAF